MKIGWPTDHDEGLGRDPVPGPRQAPMAASATICKSAAVITTMGSVLCLFGVRPRPKLKADFSSCALPDYFRVGALEKAMA